MKGRISGFKLYPVFSLMLGNEWRSIYAHAPSLLFCYALYPEEKKKKTRNTNLGTQTGFKCYFNR